MAKTAPAPVSILDCFAIPPREGQATAACMLEDKWDQADVFVIESPTGSGKTLIEFSAAKWASKVHRLKSYIGAPTNVLVQQFVRDNPRLFNLKKRHEYRCLRSTEHNSVNCKEWYDEHAASCKGCPYTKALRQCRVMPYQAGNMYTYLANRLYTDVLFVDEAHTLLGMVRDLAAKKLWYSDYQFPRNVRDYRSLLRWTEQELAKKPVLKPGQELPTKSKQKWKRLEILHADLVSGAHRYLVERGSDMLRGRTQECLKLLPIDTSTQPPVLWPPGKVKKVVLLSATIGPSDLQQLGLADRRVCWISVPSPIPPERRPVVQERFFDMSYKAQGKDLDALAEYVRELLVRHQGESGLIHVTYPLMDVLHTRLSNLPTELSSRLIYHSRSDKQQKYQQFLDAGPGAVLVCAGMYEGIDLPGDLGRWQLLTKLPWASLSDPAMKWLAETDRERYVWECLKLVKQVCGRVCRGPTDEGTTYISDRTFQNIPEEMMASWFRAAVEAGKELVTR